jgi:hypothetical protein
MLFFLSTIPGYCYEVSVSAVQKGTLQEPFDVGKTVNYDILITGASNSMRYSVEMTVGPESEPSISKSFKKDINVNGGSAMVQIPVNFQSSEFNGGEFGKWLGDKNQTEPWDEAWYKVKVTSLNPFDEQVESEDHSGKPALVKVIEVFRDQQVTPRKGTNLDEYEYQVSVLSTVQDNITLEIGPSRNGPWTIVEDQDYTTPGSWQILKWSNVSLGFDFTSAAYRIGGRRQIVADGPSWPIEVEFRNGSVSPERGLYDTPFVYSISVMAPKAIDVGVNVWDVSNKKYISAGRLGYSNVSQWQNLIWKDVMPSSAPDSNGVSNYYFSFYYEGSDNPFATTFEKEGKYYPGPTLSVVNLRNWSISPSNGTIFTPYNYSVEVETRLPSYDIELQTAPPYSEVWTAKGTATYSGGHRNLVWENVSFDPNNNAVGNGSYRFLLGELVLGKFIGPNIDVAFQDLTYNRISNTDRFDYKVKIKTSRPSLKIELIYTDDGLVWTRSKQIQEYKSNSSEWLEMAWKNQPWHKTVKFDVVRPRDE